MVNPDNWQKSMYDHRFVDWTINSPLMRMVAIKEVEALIRLLRLKPGDRILDVPCGTGRHSGALASRGFDVVGVDFNPSLLKIAKSQSPRSVRYFKGNMRNLNRFRNSFDSVINIFTSFGYFHQPQENKRVLREFALSLKSGGKLALHVANPQWLKKRGFKMVVRESQRFLTVEAGEFDEGKCLQRSCRIIFDKKSKKTEIKFFDIHIYKPKEMVKMIGQAGLTSVKIYGDIFGRPNRGSRSSHLLYVAKKP